MKTEILYKDNCKNKYFCMFCASHKTAIICDVSYIEMLYYDNEIVCNDIVCIYKSIKLDNLYSLPIFYKQNYFRDWFNPMLKWQIEIVFRENFSSSHQCPKCLRRLEL